MKKYERDAAQTNLELARVELIDDIMDGISDTLDHKLLPAVSSCRARDVAFSVDELSSNLAAASRLLDQPIEHVDTDDHKQRFEDLYKTYQQAMDEFGNGCECTRKK